MLEAQKECCVEQGVIDALRLVDSGPFFGFVGKCESLISDAGSYRKPV